MPRELCPNCKYRYHERETNYNECLTEAPEWEEVS